MTNLPAHVNPAVAKSLNLWHEMMAKKDLTDLPSIVHPDAVFRSPVTINPYRPAQALIFALSNVIELFEDFAYHRQLATDDGLNVVLEFSARLGDKSLRGIDLIRFDEQGLIAEFEVMIRPLNAVQALAAAMGARIGDRLPSFKGKD